ncbi:hypothetical protein DSC45_08705 [Streptomyces sp. YIM 130001]|uniref:hypothetical protein n=1 Tax=Streptomyces sp. YIM 130001 TaxID=2259644 RepID=UPI000ED2EF62|nr:hypothetical protein [Streptomyces sp. YIM 130001]RII18686.1 hypothetical protein DSC45_08705 [Streptomyces sp. YIM 130001]
MNSRTVMQLGLALTAAVAAVPLVDLATADSIAGHVRDAYPNWPATEVAKDRTAITVYLGTVGLLGIPCWLWAIRSAGRGSRRAPVLAGTLFTAGMCMALFGLTYASAPYERVLPLPYGLLGLLPCLAGLAAVVLLRRERADTPPSVTDEATAGAGRRAPSRTS